MYLPNNKHTNEWIQDFKQGVAKYFKGKIMQKGKFSRSRQSKENSAFCDKIHNKIMITVGRIHLYNLF